MRRRSFRVATGSAPIPPAPAFTVLPSITPSSGTVGITAFTAIDGVATLTQSYSRRWLLNGAAVSTAATYTPLLTGSLVLEVTATGPGGITVQTSTAVNVLAVGAPTLAALGMSPAPTSLQVGVTASGTITGATALSTIGLSGGPTGLTINSSARTWAYDGTGSAASGSLTLTETLAGATNTPRATSIAWAVAAAGAGGLDPTISAPTVEAHPDNAADGSSPDFLIGGDDTIDIALGYKIVARWFDKDGNLLGTGESAQLTALPSGSTIAVSGLSSLPPGTRRFDFRFERVDGSFYSNWSSPRIIVGPDDVAPVLSALSSQMVSSSSGKALFTTDTGEGTARAVFTTTNVAPSQVTVDASTFTLAISSTGAKEITGTGLTAATLYYAWVQHEDAAGNKSAITAAGSFTTDAAATFSLAETSAPATQSLGSAGKTATFSAQPIGAATSAREIIVLVDGWTGSVELPTGVTVGGIAATQVTSDFTQSIWRVAVPTGTTADVAVTYANNIDYVNIKVWRGTALGTATVHTAAGYAFRGATTDITVDTPAGGATLLHGWVEITGITQSYTNATLSSQTNTTGRSLSSALRSTSGAATVTMTRDGAGTGTNLLAVSFAP